LSLRYKGPVNNDRLKTRIETVDGVEYLVAPAVMVREQVLNGEFLPADEIQKSVEGWNGRPLTVLHPVDDNGNPVTANSPEAVARFQVGRIFNVSYDPDSTKLKCEIFFDISKKDKSPGAKAAYDAISNGEPLEVSTGYFVNETTKVFVGEGADDEQEMTAQHQLMPDHFALLPNDIGACSWEDGAGVRNNRRNPSNIKPSPPPLKSNRLLKAHKRRVKRNKLIIKRKRGTTMPLFKRNRNALPEKPNKGSNAHTQAPAMHTERPVRPMPATPETYVSTEEYLAMSPNEVAAEIESYDTPEELIDLTHALYGDYEYIGEIINECNEYIVELGGIPEVYSDSYEYEEKPYANMIVKGNKSDFGIRGIQSLVQTQSGTSFIGDDSLSINARRAK